MKDKSNQWSNWKPPAILSSLPFVRSNKHHWDLNSGLSWSQYKQRNLDVRTSYLPDITSCKFLALAILKLHSRSPTWGPACVLSFQSPEVSHSLHFLPGGQLRKFTFLSSSDLFLGSQEERLQLSLSPLTSSPQPPWQTMPHRRSKKLFWCLISNGIRIFVGWCLRNLCFKQATQNAALHTESWKAVTLPTSPPLCS